MASIRPRNNADGTTVYQVKWRANGQQRSRTAPTKTAARKVKALIELHGDFPDHLLRTDLQDAPTFGEWAKHHIDHLTGVSDRTRDDYRRQVERHFGMLTDIPLPAVTRDVVAKWVIDRKGRVSGKTLKNLHGLLHGILESAIDPGHLAANPAKGVKIPRVDDHEREDMQFLTQDEFWTLIDQVPEDWRWVFVLLAGTGLRLGEAMALTVGDVDLKAPTPVVRVNKALRYTRGKGFEVGPTKTKRSRRTVALDPTVVEALTLHLDRPAGDRLIVQPSGRPVYPTNLYARIWRPAVDRAFKAGLGKKPRIHDLRHTHASWLIAEHTPLPVIQARLGHEQITTTVDRYGHLLPDLHVQAAAATQRAFGPRAIEG